MKGQTKAKKEKSGIMRSVFTHLFTFLLGVIGALLVPLLLDRLSITEPKLIHTGPRPETPTVEGRRENGKDVLHVKTAIRLKNHGFRRGHIDKVEVVRDGMLEYPERVEILHVDKTDLGWLEEKAVGCEFIVLIDPRNLSEKRKTIRFKTYYYGPTGNEIYGETIQIEGWIPKT